MSAIGRILGATLLIREANVRLKRSLALGGTSLCAFVWIDNLLDLANVLNDYRTRGPPDDEGFPAAPLGRDISSSYGTLENIFASTIGTALLIRITIEFRGSYGLV